MTVSRRSFLSGLLASAFAPTLPPLPAPRGNAYLVFEDIPLERFASREFTYYWTPFLIGSADFGPIRAMWNGCERVI